MARYSHADYNEIIYGKEVEGMLVRELSIGDLNLPTGYIIVCDPLAYPDMPPLTKNVTPGKYPVNLYMASHPEWGERVAIAVLSFSDRKAVKFELALRENENLGALEKGKDFFGFPVEAGLGGFMDEEVLEYYDDFIENFYEKNPSKNIYTDFFAAEFKKNAKHTDDEGDWINYRFPDTQDYNLTMFSSGLGDGVYPVYWGLDDKKEIVNLVIDFHLLLLPGE